MSEGGRSRGRYGRGCVHIVLREKCVLSLREKKAPREEIVYTFHTFKYLSLGGMESIWNDGLFTVVTIVKEYHNFITLDLQFIFPARKSVLVPRVLENTSTGSLSRAREIGAFIYFTQHTGIFVRIVDNVLGGKLLPESDRIIHRENGRKKKRDPKSAHHTEKRPHLWGVK